MPTMVRHGLGNATCREASDWYYSQPVSTRLQVRRELRATCTPKEWQQCEEGGWIVLAVVVACLAIPFTLYQAWSGVAPLFMLAMALCMTVFLVAGFRRGWHQLIGFVVTGNPPAAPHGDCKRLLEDDE